MWCSRRGFLWESMKQRGNVCLAVPALFLCSVLCKASVDGRGDACAACVRSLSRLGLKIETLI